MIGDHLLQAGEFRWQDYLTNREQVMFAGVRPGEVIPLQVERAGKKLTIAWRFPGPNRQEILGRLPLIWLPYVFWVFGVLTVFLVRPCDERWRWLAAFNFLTAAWLMVGQVSEYRVWYSTLLMRVLFWWCVPVYWRLHWAFPRPLRRLPAGIWAGLFGLSAAVSLAEIAQVTPYNFYYIGFLLALTGSLVLLGVHWFTRPEQRRDLGLLLVAAGLITLPSLIMGIAGLLNIPPIAIAVSFFSLPLLPGAYFYAIYRRQLGGLELRANRIITLLAFAILLVSFADALVAVTVRFFALPETAISLALGFTLAGSLGSLWLYPHFARWFERHLLGMPLPPTRLVEAYAARMLGSLELNCLRRLLGEEILPSLLVRQAVLLRLDGQQVKVLFSLSPGEVPDAAQVQGLLTGAGQYRLPVEAGGPQGPCAWVRLALAASERAGDLPDILFLLGRRDPDDLYAASEIPALQALADQTALALQTITLTGQVQALYRHNISRQEAERSRLARELHDSVLNELAVLVRHVDVKDAQFHQVYAAIIQRIRDIISGLRPAMLNFGLWTALQELADDTGQQVGGEIDIQAQVPPSQERYPLEVEMHLYRIVQQACQNALKHARAGHIQITGQMEAEQVFLSVQDDGAGFALGEGPDLGSLLANQHFGLAGMYERAGLIGAQLQIQSAPGQGTTIRVAWQNASPQAGRPEETG